MKEPLISVRCGKVSPNHKMCYGVAGRSRQQCQCSCHGVKAASTDQPLEYVTKIVTNHGGAK